MESPFNAPLGNEVFGIMKDIFRPRYGKKYGKEPRYKGTLLWRRYQIQKRLTQVAINQLKQSLGITRLRCIRDLFHIFYHIWVEKNIVLYAEEFIT